MNFFGSTFAGQKDYLESHTSLLSKEIMTLRAERHTKLSELRYQAMQQALDRLPDIKVSKFDASTDIIQIGAAQDLNPQTKELIAQAIEAFVPWRKGPFDIFGEVIDAEWRSELKWNRVLPHLRPLKDKKVCDIGCNNGYFMYRMLPHEPRLVVGLEPESRNVLNFNFLQKYARAESLFFEPLGIEHMNLYPGFFDTVFCMGILYHHTDPVGLLKKIFGAMAKGGQLIVECQGIPGEEPLALMPENRYANARGFWWLPTRSCLEHWLKRSGFTKVETFADLVLTSEEQRRSSHAPINSLDDFLDKEDRSKTIEGYPAPRRFYVSAIRP
jgi:tRNA (mo5U34)-methyltransferase